MSIVKKSIVTMTVVGSTTKLSSAEINEIRRMKEQGFHYSDICEHTGISMATVYRYAGRMSETQKQNRKQTTCARRSMIRMVAENKVTAVDNIVELNTAKRGPGRPRKTA